ncbi:MAG: hypothetical protein R3A44_43365 [Caldilineaceae bacterium]
MVQSRIPAQTAEIHLVFPILPGQAEAWRRFVQELCGPQQADWRVWRERVGLKQLRVHLQSTPKQTLALLRIECSQEEDRLGPFILHKVPFDRWLREQIMTLHGVDLADLGSVGQLECRLDIDEWTHTQGRE